MSRFASILTAVAVLAVSGTAVFAQDKMGATKPVAKKPAAQKLANVMKDGKAICPVMGDEFTVKPNSIKAVVNGKTYAFCCDGCKAPFVKNPAKYITEAKPAPKTPAKDMKKKS